MELVQGYEQLLSARSDLAEFADAWRAVVQRDPVNVTKALREIDASLEELSVEQAAVSGIGAVPVLAAGALAGRAALRYGSKAWPMLRAAAGRASAWVSRALKPAAGAAAAGTGAVSSLTRGGSILALLAAGSEIVKRAVAPALGTLLKAAWPLLALAAAFLIFGNRRKS